MHPRLASFLLLVATLHVVSCGDGSSTGATSLDNEPIASDPVEGTASWFDLDADLTREESFFDLPWPSDLRLRADGRPILDGFPGASGNGIVGPVLRVADRRRGHSVNPSAIFRFDGPLGPQHLDQIHPPVRGAPVLLVDIDESSPERGRLFPVVAETPPPDPFVPRFALSLSVPPGIVLAPDRTYAFVVLRSLRDAAGDLLGVGSSFAQLRAGRTPKGARGGEALALYAPLWSTLDDLGIARTDVATATVLTTGDIVAESAEWMEALAPRLPVEIVDLVVEPVGGGEHERFCELTGSIEMPQLQRGTPPYDQEGDFEIGPAGLPVVQRHERVPIVLTLPRSPMPDGGYPLVLYVHGSGGRSDQVVDRGPVLEPGGERIAGQGPAHVYAAHGIATAAAAMPLNPQRLPGAASREYLNFLNLGAYPFTFLQGAFELRLFLDALATLEIDPSVVTNCGGINDGEGIRFATDGIGLHGQSMGAQYASMLGALDPRVGAVLPTGSGGLWTLVILIATIEDGLDVGTLIGPLLGTDAPVSHLHPALQLVQFALEPAETMIFAPRIGHRPLPGHPARHLFQPVGRNDPGFPNEIYDAMALASGNAQAGDVVWPSLQEALALDGLDGLIAYPVGANRTSVDGRSRAGVVVQYEGDGILDSHHIFAQRDDLKHQYGCWFESFFRDGSPTLPPPGPIDAPCP